MRLTFDATNTLTLFGYLVLDVTVVEGITWVRLHDGYAGGDVWTLMLELNAAALSQTVIAHLMEAQVKWQREHFGCEQYKSPLRQARRDWQTKWAAYDAAGGDPVW